MKCPTCGHELREDGTFIGRMGQLERLQRRHRAQINWLTSFRGTTTTELYVDGAGTIYARSPESHKFTRVVGFCIPKGD